MDAAFLAAGEQAGVLKDAQVPRDRRQRNRVGLGQFAGSRLALREVLKNAAADRVSERRESGVEMR